jgi:exopolysaccharide biosynthesis polyprenyl glycosylphosphotransferase
VGTGARFKSLCEKIEDRPDLGLSLIGYLEESPSGNLPNVPLLGSIGELEKVVVHFSIEHVIATLKPGRGSEVSRIVDICNTHKAECYVSPDLQQLIVGSHKIDEIAGIPVIRIRGLRLSGFGLFVKRSSDIVFTLIILTFILPFLIMLAILIKLDSPGPIFYMQKRVGLDGKEFWMYKFRSMRTGAEEREGPAWSQDEDPRVTRLGFILRKLSIDELPQIFNVISGEMSLVGPRPERPFFVEQFEKDVPRYMQRHRVKAGMTGWAQVNGLRGDTSIEERVQYDLYYIENWSFWFDIKIMILTAVDILKEIPRVTRALKGKSSETGSGNKP